MIDPVPYPGRRDPCPCGSSERFKNCCDGAVRFDEQKLLRMERRTPGALQAMSDKLQQDWEARR